MNRSETHSLDGLQRGFTYYISIVALSKHLPSPEVKHSPINSKSHFPLPDHFLLSLAVAAEPTNLTVSMSEYSNTHVIVTVSWEPADDNFTTGYVISYKSKEEPMSTDNSVSSENKLHSLCCLQRGVPYNISIIAESDLLNSTIGPLTFIGM